MNSYKKFAKDTGLTGVSQIAVAIKGLILLPILTKTLGPELYGIWSQIMVTVSLLMPLALLQLEYAMSRFLSGEKEKDKISIGVSSISAIVLLTATVLSVFIFIFAEPFAASVFGSIGSAQFIRISSYLVLITTLDQLVYRYFISFRQMKRYSTLTILQTICEILLISFFVLSGYELFGAIISLLFVRTFIFIIGFLLIESEIKITAPSCPVIKLYLSFSMPLILFQLFYWMISLGDRYVIGYFLGSDAVGIYSASYTIGSLVGFIYNPIAVVLLPAITILYENNKTSELENHLEYSIKFFLMLAIPSVFGLYILSQPLLEMLTTSEFIKGYEIIPIIGLGVTLFSCSTLFTDILILLKQSKKVSAIYGLFALIKLVMNIILVPVIGIVGAALAALVTFSFLSVVLALLCFKKISFPLDFRFIAISILSSMIMSLLVALLNSIGVSNILITIGIAMITYFCALFLFNGFSQKELAFMKEIIAGITKKI